MSWNIAIDEPMSFEMLRPATVEAAVEMGERLRDDAAYLAGGCDLVEKLKLQSLTCRYVINLKSVSGLKGVQRGAASVRIGALTTLGEIERDETLGGLAAAASRVATPQIRNAATIGGNLLQDSRCPYYRGPWHCYRAGGIVCDAKHGIHREHAIFGGDRCITVSPSDTAPMLVALDAAVEVAGRAGVRRLPASGLFVGPDENIRAMHRLGPGEILTVIEVPLRPALRSVFVKYAVREAWDFAIVSAAVAASRDGGAVRGVRVVLGAVAPTPWRSAAAEAEIEGKPLTVHSIERAAQAAVSDAAPSSDSEYKVALVRKAVREALTQLSVAV